MSCNHGDSGVGLEVWELETEDYGPGLLKFASRNRWVNYHLQKKLPAILSWGWGVAHVILWWWCFLFTAGR